MVVNRVCGMWCRIYVEVSCLATGLAQLLLSTRARMLTSWEASVNTYFSPINFGQFFIHRFG